MVHVRISDRYYTVPNRHRVICTKCSREHGFSAVQMTNQTSLKRLILHCERCHARLEILKCVVGAERALNNKR